MAGLTRPAIRLGLAAVLLAGLAACGGESAGTSASEAAPVVTETTASADAAQTPAATSAGQAEVAFDGKAESFDLVNCVSGSEASVQGSGRNDTYSLMLDVQDGSGPVTLSDVSDMSVYLDGSTEQVTVSADGSFTVSGSYVADGQEGQFTATGTCGMVTWS